MQSRTDGIPQLPQQIRRRLAEAWPDMVDKCRNSALKLDFLCVFSNAKAAKRGISSC